MITPCPRTATERGHRQRPAPTALTGRTPDVSWFNCCGAADERYRVQNRWPRAFRIAARLGITPPDEIWPGLVKAATFDHMKAAADRLKPLGNLESNAAFFPRGISGSSREVLTADELARYYARTAQLAPADLLAWLHRQDGGAT